MTVKLLMGHHLEFLSLKAGCTGSSESILVKMPHYWNHKSQLISCELSMTKVLYLWGKSGFI